jgi:hypothetical protein
VKSTSDAILLTPAGPASAFFRQIFIKQLGLSCEFSLNNRKNINSQ